MKFSFVCLPLTIGSWSAFLISERKAGFADVENYFFGCLHFLSTISLLYLVSFPDESKCCGAFRDDDGDDTIRERRSTKRSNVTLWRVSFKYSPFIGQIQAYDMDMQDFNDNERNENGSERQKYNWYRCYSLLMISKFYVVKRYWRKDRCFLWHIEILEHLTQSFSFLLITETCLWRIMDVVSKQCWEINE